MSNMSDQKQREQSLVTRKTELLVRRVLKMSEPMIKMVFMRKAASEMREAARPERMDNPERWTITRKTLHRERLMGWILLDNPGRLRLDTIDNGDPTDE